ncbi:MAG: ABC-type transport auxiliary lipoprotein family protein [Pseudomonadota bacterium]
MMKRRPSFALSLVTLAVLSACGGAAERFAAPLAPPGARIGINVALLEVRQVSLPSYALEEEIWIETETGALTADANLLWADDPARAVTQEVARQLAAISGARVAAEPWPFEDLPEARVELRIDEFIAGNDGRFRISGQGFAVAVTAGQDRVFDFAVSAPVAAGSGTPGLAVARSEAIRDLARRIAEAGL